MPCPSCDRRRSANRWPPRGSGRGVSSNLRPG
jgi:hypothetical protein